MSKNNLVFLSLLLGTALAAIEGTIVATAANAIEVSFSSAQQIGLLFSSYLLLSGLCSLFFGKLADLWSDKIVLIIGFSLFIIGSLLSGLSSNILWLVIFRGIQGIGSGAIVPVSRSMVGYLFPTKEERAKAQSMETSVWGIAGIIGPFIGGVIIRFLSWRYIFFLNVPFALLAIILISINLSEPLKHRIVKFDYVGSGLIFIASISLFVSLYSKSIFISLTAWINTIAVFIGWYLYENQTNTPLINLSLARDKHVFGINLLTLTTGILAAGLNAYLPLWGQQILHFSATSAGSLLTPMMIFWSVGSIINTSLIKRISLKTALLLGTALLLLSSLTLSFFEALSLWSLYLTTTVFGLGMGISVSSLMIYLQFNSPKEAMGSTMGLNSFVLMMSKAIGVAILGAIYGKHIVYNWLPQNNSFGIVFLILGVIALSCILVVVKLPKSKV